MDAASAHGLNRWLMPVLNELDEQATFSFLKEWASFKRRGGDKNMRDAIADEVFDFLKLHAMEAEDEEAEDAEAAGKTTDWEKISDDDLRQVLQAFFAPRSRVQALDKLKRITMVDTTSFELSPVLAYCVAFQHAWGKLPKEFRPKTRTVVSQFVANLRPKAIGNEIRLMDLDSVKEAIRAALKIARNFAELPLQRGGAAGSTGATSKPRGSGHSKTDPSGTKIGPDVASVCRLQNSERQDRTGQVSFAVRPRSDIYSGGTRLLCPPRHALGILADWRGTGIPRRPGIRHTIWSVHLESHAHGGHDRPTCICSSSEWHPRRSPQLRGLPGRHLCLRQDQSGFSRNIAASVCNFT